METENGASYQVWLCDPFGNRIRQIDELVGLEYFNPLNHIGDFTLSFPRLAREAFVPPSSRPKNFTVDQIVQIWRAPGWDKRTKKIFSGFIKHWTINDTDVVLKGKSMNQLLKTRIVAYPADELETDKNGPADDVIKEIIRENLGNQAIAARDLSAFGFSVDADTSSGPDISKSFAWASILELLQELAAASRQQGTRLYFWIDHPADKIFVFRTAVNLYGSDRTAVLGSKPLIFSQEMNNLGEPVYEEDHTDAISMVYVGGQGEEDERIIVSVEDTTRSKASPWGRVETFRDARHIEDPDHLPSLGYEELAANRPKKRFRGRLLHTPDSLFGIHWDIGDRVQAQFNNTSFTGVIDGIKVVAMPGVPEDIQAYIEVDLTSEASSALGIGS